MYEKLRGETAFDVARVSPPDLALRGYADKLIADLEPLRRLPDATTVGAKREAAVMCMTGNRAKAKVRAHAQTHARPAAKSATRLRCATSSRINAPVVTSPMHPDLNA